MTRYKADVLLRLADAGCLVPGQTVEACLDAWSDEHPGAYVPWASLERESGLLDHVVTDTDLDTAEEIMFG